MREVDLALHPDADTDAGLHDAAARALGVDPSRVSGLAVLRRTIDARRGRVTLRYRLTVAVDEPFTDPHHDPVPDLPALKGAPEVVIIGAGPAGLFAAHALAEHGVPSVVLERGADVRGRRPALARLNREGVLDPDSNYCFGEGGAGTFSDGKLYTRATKRGRVADVLRLLVACGAPPRILFDARPHIGTNRLPEVVVALRERLRAAGSEVRFDTRVVDLTADGVRLASGDVVPARAVVVATGHSARDVYRLLADNGVALEAKPFALGLRIEHPQALVDRVQYGALAGHPRLGAAPYALKRTVDGVSVYSFCMCPGGFVVAATTDVDAVVVNGMSPSRRDAEHANSGMVVTVTPDLYGEGPLAALELQAEIERAAYAAGGGRFRAPAQRLPDLLAGRVSASLPACSYRPGLTAADVGAVLPAAVRDPLLEAVRWFDAHRMRGYVTEEAVAIGVESRSSAPVRIPRDPESLQSTSHPALYPCGEGAGYAGGIVSAALDGMRVARAISDRRRSGW